VDARNRLTGYSYDLSGNMLGDSVHQYAYDAESRIKTVDPNLTPSAATYLYDGSGNRVAEGCRQAGGPSFRLAFPRETDWAPHSFLPGALGFVLLFCVPLEMDRVAGGPPFPRSHLSLSKKIGCPSIRAKALSRTKDFLAMRKHRRVAHAFGSASFCRETDWVPHPFLKQLRPLFLQLRRKRVRDDHSPILTGPSSPYQ
jgi:hypothetical protein